MNTKPEGDIEITLLETLISGPKVLDWGRCPVTALSVAMKLTEKGLARIDGSRISITLAGRAALARTEPRS